MLSSDQVISLKEVSDFLIGDETEHILSGSPGTGKSYLTSEILEVAEKLQYYVVPAATTNPAVKVLEDLCGHPGYTIHNVLDLRVQNDFTKNTTYLVPKSKATFWNNYFNSKTLFASDISEHRITSSRKVLIIIDEASYIDEDIHKYIARMLDEMPFLVLKILYIGDKNQLPPVDTNVPFIFNTKINRSELTTNHRFPTTSQIHNLCETLKFEIENKSFYVPKIESDSEITVLNGADFEQAIKDAYTSEEFAVDPYYLKTVAYRNTIVDGINDLVRSHIGYSKEYEEGERIIFNKPYFDNNGGRFAANGEIATILEIVKSEYMEIPGFNIKFYTPSGEFKGFYTPHVRLISRYKKKLIQEKQWAKAETFVNSCISIKPLYASTVHKAQGASYDNIYIHLADLFQCKDVSLLPRLLYVALSRAREHVYIYGSVPSNFQRKKK